jgi:hypothetical protein
VSISRLLFLTKADANDEPALGRAHRRGRGSEARHLPVPAKIVSHPLDTAPGRVMVVRASLTESYFVNQLLLRIKQLPRLTSAED